MSLEMSKSKKTLAVIAIMAKALAVLGGSNQGCYG